MKKVLILAPALLFLIQSCGNDNDVSDAYGNFESVSVMVAAESPGKLVSLNIEEGQELALNEVVGTTDTIQFYLKKQQLIATIRTVNTRSATVEAQIGSQKVQLKNLEKEDQRLANLLKDGAATGKQKDDLEGSIALLRAQLKTLESQKPTIMAEKQALMVQIEQVNDQITRSRITNPIKGLVLQKYKQEGEIVGPGQAIYKIANLDKLILRAYIAGQQLSELKLGQELKVRIDGANGIEELTGVVTWISSQAEFTPKIIQTREERVNLVYALKVEVINDGRLKIGMPGEIKL